MLTVVYRQPTKAHSEPEKALQYLLLLLLIIVIVYKYCHWACHRDNLAWIEVMVMRHQNELSFSWLNNYCTYKDFREGIIIPFT